MQSTLQKTIAEELKIPLCQQSTFSREKVTCMVHESWLGSILGSGVIPEVHSVLEPGEIGLARSQDSLQDGWMRVNILTVAKNNCKVPRPTKGMCLLNQEDSIIKALTNLTQTDFKNSWLEAYLEYGSNLFASGDTQLSEEDFNTFVLGLINTVYNCPVIHLTETQSTGTGQQRSSHMNTATAHCVLVTQTSFYIITPYIKYTLHDMVSLSPAILSTCHAKPLFIIYQLLQVAACYHQHAVCIGNMTLTNVIIDDKLWIKVDPICNGLLKDFIASNGKQKKDVNEEVDLPSLTEKWLHGRLSNFQYLMSLNRLCGRRMGDPNNHPVLPWVTDFTVPNSGYRDLSKSKYRLNKGDEQLDITFRGAHLLAQGQVSNAKNALSIPHHISDVLSDITYYVYKARQTARDVLCAHVRSQWVPNEYPSNMHRLQAWTPDECIPEFFTTPAIFKSIHDDLPDLGIPPWCSSPEDFIKKHMAILESDHVSQNLHKWIDLTFGFKLGGSAAVKAMNVCLQLVNNHTNLTNHGVVQLFDHPHPRKIGTTAYSSHNAPHILRNTESYEKLMAAISDQVKIQSSQDSVTQGTSEAVRDTYNGCIILPSDFNPVEQLEQIEDQYNFTNKVLHQDNDTPYIKNVIYKRSEDITSRDMQAIGCIIAEMFLLPRLRMMRQDISLKDRVHVIRQVTAENLQDIPSTVRGLVVRLLCLDSKVAMYEDNTHLAAFQYPGTPPTPCQLLHPTSATIQFPVYFKHLYNLLSELKQMDAELAACCDRRKSLKLKIDTFSSSIKDLLPLMDGAGMSLILPYISDMFMNTETSVIAFWSLFNDIARAIGQSETLKHFLGAIIKLYEGECNTQEHLKMYHKTFLLQLCIRLGLGPFLNNISTLLIEAVAGYKDFVETSFDSQFSEDDPADYDMPARRELHRQSSVESIPGDDVVDNEEVQSDGLSQSDKPMMDTTQCIEIPTAQDDDDSTGSVEQEILLSKSPTTEHSHNVLDTGECSPVIGRRAAIVSMTPLHSNDNAETMYNIRHAATDSVIWLSQRLGPLLTAKFLSRNLLRMLSLCYLGEEQLVIIQEETNIPLLGSKTLAWKGTLSGDKNACNVIECLKRIIILYGEQVILLQYIKHVTDSVALAKTRLTLRAEASLIGSLELLYHIVPFMSDSTVIDNIQTTLITTCLRPILDLVVSTDISFPAGHHTRAIITYKLLNLMYIIALRVERERSRQFFIPLLQRLFRVFDVVAGRITEKKGLGLSEKESLTSSSEYLNIKQDSATKEYHIGTPVQVQVHSPARVEAGSWNKRSHSLTPVVLDKDEFDEAAIANKEKIAEEIRQVFTAEMASIIYVPFCRIIGDIYMEVHLRNDDHIRQLCAEHDKHLNTQQRASELTRLAPDDNSDSSSDSDGDSETAQIPVGTTQWYIKPVPEVITTTPIKVTTRGQSFDLECSGSFGKVTMTGNKLVSVDDLHQPNVATSNSPRFKSHDFSTVDPEKLKSSKMFTSGKRHLKGNWLAYWEHELGLGERQENNFNFKQITLQSFHGHPSSIRCFDVLDNESTFMTASKDKTVKLWSLKSHGDGSSKSRCQWTYSEHKKAVFAVTFIESMRLAASCDGTLHLWDPFIGKSILQYDSTRTGVLTHLCSIPGPSSTLIAATNDATLRFVDARKKDVLREYKCAIGPAGLIRSVTVSPNGQWVVVGYSTGLVSLLDIRTGWLLGTWKAHDSEIMMVNAYDNSRFVTSSLDQSMTLWSTDSQKPVYSLQKPSETVHSFSFYKNEIISITIGNRVGVHTGLDTQPSFSSTKLRSDTFKGVLTTMALLPLNRQLLLGADNGTIKLLC